MSAALESVLDAETRLDVAAFALAGRAPRAAFAPRDAEEVSELLRACASDGWGVRIWGGGVHQVPMTPDAKYDVALSLARFDRVVDHEPGDLTCTLGAGLTLERAAAALAKHGQELPLESAQVARATVGGVCSVNASGARRVALGSPRDRVLGMRFVTGDGVIARAGGRVVKNVAGYGTHRMLCGSHGTLAVILEVSFKLLPSPARRVALLYALGAAPPSAEALRAVRMSRMEPAVLTVLGPGVPGGVGPGWTLVLGLEADAPWVAEQEELAKGILGAPARRMEQDEAFALWRALADLDVTEGLSARAVVPSRVAETLAELHATGAAGTFAHVESGGVRAKMTGQRDDGAGAEPALDPLRARLQSAFGGQGVLA